MRLADTWIFPCLDWPVRCPTSRLLSLGRGGGYPGAHAAPDRLLIGDHIQGANLSRNTCSWGILPQGPPPGQRTGRSPNRASRSPAAFPAAGSRTGKSPVTPLGARGRTPCRPSQGSYVALPGGRGGEATHAPPTALRPASGDWPTAPRGQLCLREEKGPAPSGRRPGPKEEGPFPSRLRRAAPQRPRQLLTEEEAVAGRVRLAALLRAVQGHGAARPGPCARSPRQARGYRGGRAPAPARAQQRQQGAHGGPICAGRCSGPGPAARRRPLPPGAVAPARLVSGFPPPARPALEADGEIQAPPKARRTRSQAAVQR